MSPESQPPLTPETPQSPTPEPSLTPTSTPNPTAAPAATDPGHTLGIVGLIVVFISSIIGLIISIVAYNKSKNAGYKNAFAKWGIIVGSILTVVGIIAAIALTVFAVNIYGQVTEKCEDLGTSRVYVNGQYYPCPTTSSSTTDSDAGSTPASGVTEIEGTSVTLAGSEVDSTCFTFDMPENYLLSPKAESCQVEIRSENGTATGEALSSLVVKAQRGDNTIDSFFSTIKASSPSAVTEKVTVNGASVGKATYKNGSGFTETSYYIPDDSGKYERGGTPITSYFISGPSYPEEFEDILSGVVESFTVK